ncbi:hypothetical protein FPV67DRAFT_1456794 [Lyophyllum atratum]|nr:hypothetical protein FPV67DRAFT_1456794 [Lyophyllum atratum]
MSSHSNSSSLHVGAHLSPSFTFSLQPPSTDITGSVISFSSDGGSLGAGNHYPLPAYQEFSQQTTRSRPSPYCEALYSNRDPSRADPQDVMGSSIRRASFFIDTPPPSSISTSITSSDESSKSAYHPLRRFFLNPPATYHHCQTTKNLAQHSSFPVGVFYRLTGFVLYKPVGLGGDIEIYSDTRPEVEPDVKMGLQGDCDKDVALEGGFMGLVRLSHGRRLSCHPPCTQRLCKVRMRGKIMDFIWTKCLTPTTLAHAISDPLDEPSAEAYTSVRCDIDQFLAVSVAYSIGGEIQSQPRPLASDTACYHSLAGSSFRSASSPHHMDPTFDCIIPSKLPTENAMKSTGQRIWLADVSVLTALESNDDCLAALLTQQDMFTFSRQEQEILTQSPVDFDETKREANQATSWRETEEELEILTRKVFEWITLLKQSITQSMTKRDCNFRCKDPERLTLSGNCRDHGQEDTLEWASEADSQRLLHQGEGTEEGGGEGQGEGEERGQSQEEEGFPAPFNHSIYASADDATWRTTIQPIHMISIDPSSSSSTPRLTCLPARASRTSAIHHSVHWDWNEGTGTPPRTFPLTTWVPRPLPQHQRSLQAQIEAQAQSLIALIHYTNSLMPSLSNALLRVGQHVLLVQEVLYTNSNEHLVLFLDDNGQEEMVLLVPVEIPSQSFKYLAGEPFSVIIYNRKELGLFPQEIKSRAHWLLNDSQKSVPQLCMSPSLALKVHVQAGQLREPSPLGCSQHNITKAPSQGFSLPRAITMRVPNDVGHLSWLAKDLSSTSDTALIYFGRDTYWTDSIAVCAAAASPTQVTMYIWYAQDTVMTCNHFLQSLVPRNLMSVFNLQALELRSVRNLARRSQTTSVGLKKPDCCSTFRGSFIPNFVIHHVPSSACRGPQHTTFYSACEKLHPP